MSFGVHPLIVLAAVGALLALIAVVVFCLARNRGVRLLMVVVALVDILPAAYLFVVLHPALVDGRFRTYRAFYDDIQTGMTRDEVLVALDRHYPESGARLRPKVMDDTTERLGFFMNPETSREPNCEGIFLKLQNGRVVSKMYSPD